MKVVAAQQLEIERQALLPRTFWVGKCNILPRKLLLKESC